MNVQFGSAMSTPHPNLAQGSDARDNVAVPADSENRSTTSFTPVEETQKNTKPKQEDSLQGVEERQARNDQRAKSKLDRQNRENRQQDQQQERQLEDRQVQRARDQAQVDASADARKQQEAAQQRQLEVELRQIQKLAERDREVKAHEQAHVSVGAQFTGAMSLNYERGPDGKNYAVAGEVSIDTSKVANDPQATQHKAQTIRAAALAPADPSSQDRRVAAQANQMVVEARAEIEKVRRDEIGEESQEEDQEQSKEVATEERLDVQEKTQTKEQRDKVVLNENAASFQESSERLARIQAQLVEVSQIDDKVKAGINLLDVAT